MDFVFIYRFDNTIYIQSKEVIKSANVKVISEKREVVYTGTITNSVYERITIDTEEEGYYRVILCNGEKTIRKHLFLKKQSNVCNLN